MVAELQYLLRIKAKNPKQEKGINCDRIIGLMSLLKNLKCNRFLVINRLLPLSQWPIILVEESIISGAMKNIRHIKKGDSIDNRMDISNHQVRIPKSKLLTGSLTGLYPIILDGGRTIIFISDKNKESETRKNYELRKDNRVNHYVKKPKV